MSLQAADRIEVCMPATHFSSPVGHVLLKVTGERTERKYAMLIEASAPVVILSLLSHAIGYSKSHG